ncbi:321_t:CDS:2, partial [Funneliformis geosporum]
KKKQASVELQLAVFLHRIGGKSNIFEICLQFGIAEGTPKGEQRKLAHKGFQLIGGFTNVIGAIDRTHLILNNKPSNSPELYFNRKKCYLIQCQEIVDFHEIFISYDIGWPGSVDFEFQEVEEVEMVGAVAAIVVVAAVAIVVVVKVVWRVEK